MVDFLKSNINSLAISIIGGLIVIFIGFVARKLFFTFIKPNGSNKTKEMTVIDGGKFDNNLTVIDGGSFAADHGISDRNRINELHPKIKVLLKRFVDGNGFIHFEHFIDEEVYSFALSVLEKRNWVERLDSGVIELKPEILKASAEYFNGTKK